MTAPSPLHRHLAIYLTDDIIQVPADHPHSGRFGDVSVWDDWEDWAGSMRTEGEPT